MTYVLKILVTFIAGTLIAAIMFLRRGDRGSADTRVWRGGEADPVRRLLLDSDGTVRTSAKIGVLVAYGIFALILWFLVPASD